MASDQHNQTDATLRRFRCIASHLHKLKRAGVCIDPEFEEMTIEHRIKSLYDALGETPAARERIVRIDSGRPWGPGNLSWSSHVKKEKWSPTAQCPRCKKWDTAIRATSQVRGIRYHVCNTCGSQFMTQMEELGLPSLSVTKRRNLAALSRQTGISAGAIARRLKRGWTLKRATTQPPCRVLTHQGRTQSIKAWADELKISTATIYQRRCLGWSDEKILGTPVRRRGNKSQGACPAINKCGEVTDGHAE